jgi:hypothetical protein
LAPPSSGPYYVCERDAGRGREGIARRGERNPWVRTPAGEGAWRLLRRVSTRLGDLAMLDRDRTGDAEGSDNLAIRDEGNAAFERRGSAPRERAQPKAVLRYQVLEHLAWAPEVKRAARLILGDRDQAVRVV